MRRSAVVLLVLASFVACGRREAVFPRYEKAPVILISVDTLRSDHLPAYGYRGVETPAIDALARDGMLFEHAYAHCPMTLPSHVSMLTGLTGTEHGVRNNLGFHFDAQKIASLPIALKHNGYATGAAVSSYVLRGDTGLRDAFDDYEDSVNPPPGSSFADHQRSGATTTALAEQWIGAHSSQPFFFFLHLYEPHVPYEPPEPYRSRYANRYDGEIATADAIVGNFVQFLKAKGIYDRAIVVFTSDHGEGLGDHGEMQHSILLYREAIQVPLILKLPASARHGERVSAPAGLVDIARTVAELTGVDLKTPSAASLLALPPSRDIYSETIYPYVQLGWSDLRSIVNERSHYIDSSSPELYALRSDPAERKNVIGDERRAAAAFQKELATFPPATSASTAVDAETAAKLAALGYVGAARNRPDPRSLPNPRDVIAYLGEIQVAFQLADEKQYPAALEKLRAIVQKNPRMTDVWIRLAQVYGELGEAEPCIAAYRNAMASSGVPSPEVALMLGNFELQSGRLDDAAQAAQATMSASPDAATELLARVALARKDYATAESLARKLTSPAGAVLLGEILEARGDRSGALAATDEARRRAQAAGVAHVYGLEALRGDVLALTDHPAEAIAAFETEIGAFPQNRIAYSRLAILYHLTGDHARFESTLRKLVTANPTPAARQLAAKTRTELGVR